MITALLAAMLASPPAPDDIRDFGNWIVGCDNTLACEAFSLDPPNAEGTQPAAIVVERAAGDDGRFRVGIRSFEDDPPARYGLIVDGEHLGWAEGGEEDVRYFPAERATQITYRLANGSEARLENGGGEALGSISLDGSYAALLFIEDRQGRAGTVTAAVAVGDEPAEQVPPTPGVPEIAVPPLPETADAAPLEAERAAALRERWLCGEDDTDPRRNEAHRLGDGLDLLVISCEGGAYNFSDFVYIRLDGAITPAAFDTTVGFGDQTDMPPLLVNVWWDAETGTLHEYMKGRGLGDCGTARSFVWDGEMFRLIERRSMPECRGSPHWITTHRARFVRRASN